MIDEFTHKSVKTITFGVMSPKFIKEMASAKIVTPELYDKEGYPVDGGLMDIRLGVIDPGLVCKTCGSKLKECIGHFGYIELARPIIHIKFVTVILDLLRCTCMECGKILIPKNKLTKYTEELDRIGQTLGMADRREKVKEIITALKTVKKCPHCNAKQFKIRLEKPTTYLEDEKRLSPIEVRTRLEKVSDEDSVVFGLNPKAIRPEWMVLTILPIPPVTVRPSITLESGERSEDDLTHKLGDIVRINQRLFENINAGAPEIIIEDLWDLLQYHVTTFFDNEVAQLPPARHRSGQPLKTITSRIKSKEGRIRHNLAGKRTNFSARTVISPDSRLRINEVGVPRVIAMKLTVPERLQAWNAEYLKAFVSRGPDGYPGANYIIRPDGKRKKITNETKEQLLEELQPGYIVERHLMDGDIAIFNRQPSLHRMSMMCHRVRVLPGLTLRLNPAVCAPYNADFDGDEMNLHVPQTEEASDEAEILMEVQTQLISPRYGLSIIGCNQDAISGNFILTRQGFAVPRQEAIDMLASVGITEFKDLPDKPRLTGKDIFSVLLPKDFNFKGYSRLHREGKSDPDGLVEIRDGQLVSGVLDKNNLGEGSGLLLRYLHKRYGQARTIDILGKIYLLGIETLQRHGFTSGLSHIDLSEEAHAKIEETVSAAYNAVDEFVERHRKGELEVMPGRTAAETLELRILERLNKARDDVGRIVTENVRPSTTLVMVKAGAKGSQLQMAQMSAVVGQQALRGRRIDSGYAHRTLSCFRRNDLGPTARGFIRRGFKEGLAPHELFFMAMTGRDSLMDTALRTPKSGYLYRRLSNAMQDLKVEYDMTVRDAASKIVQFSYGEDGVDVSKSEGGHINVKHIVNSVL